ncbi:nuclear factor of activated T-cells, cytoplasmic 3 isoform X3 [Agelaius tricolor]|uniref:nuclear factor of activated T-cells, cytoplasmic 3 isoform X3 n=1 Tax=Agelaius phoeniceus TaxID=39638 RepID=UPI0023EC7106|nr:nuclear factor of activated T-cells, cytoplasmic 3 isoform X3 [Agelaius phoeniceus]
MTTANCGATDEFDFRLIFGEDGQPGPGPPLGPADLESDDCASIYIFNVEQPSSSVNQPICIPRHGLQSHSSPTRFQSHKNYEGTCEVPESKYSPLGGPKPFECPSIQITSISPNCHQGIEANEDELHTNGTENEYMERPSRDHLYLPLEPSYRESSLSPSPASSISSRSWFSDASSCESISHVYDDVDSELNEAAARFTLGSPLASPGGSPRGPSDESWQQPYGFGHALSPRQSPCHSPRTSITDENWLSPRPTSRPSSRPTSPCGKRRHSSAEICYAGSLSPHHSPTPSPGHSPRGSITEDTWLNTSIHNVQGLNSGLSPFQCCTETDIPLKTRKTSEDQTATLSGKIDICPEEQGTLSSSLETAVDDCSGSQHTLKKDLPGDQFLSVPSHFTWNKPKPGHTPIFRTSSLPPLDWPLPSHYGQCELKIEVQPKTHHRAHYETEGSRGAVKASTGGHPVVKLLGYSEKPVNLQMFIGTADDRYLRPHAFYQVHRITGKTVATASQEIIIASTKVLEIPLLPENNMSASIDCAGILKLRNSDIELRKGETDIGRKNTRVRLVFRVHIPQPSGKVLSLQTASIPVECSQRSAQELPQIEKYSINSCSVNGGHEMVVTGSNFLPESKIIFFEKGQDGRPQWEVEGKIIREKCQGANIILEVPPYHNKAITAAVQVQFYLCNGKRKKSQSQRFTYTPVIMKQEHRDEVDLSAVPSLALPHAGGVQGLHSMRAQLPSPEQGHPHDNLLSTSPRSLVCPMQPPYTAMVTSAVPHLPHMQGRNLSPSEECHVLPPAVVQSFQDAAVPHLINLSCQALPPVQFHSSNPGPVSASSPAGHPLANAAHSGQSPAQLPSMGFHCPGAGQGSIPSAMSRSLGQASPQLQQVPFHSPNPAAASSPSPTASHPLGHSPLSGPSSPQLQPLPYQSPSSGPAPSPPPGSRSGQHSPQAASPALGALGTVSPLGPHPGCDSAPFAPEGAAVHIKPEPEDRELNFQTIGLQDITLDDDSFISDLEYQPSGSTEKWTQHSALMSNSFVENLEVNEIIGRDMSQISVSHGAPVASQPAHPCPGSLETRISDGIQ